MEWMGQWWDVLIVRVGGYAVVIGAVGTAIYKAVQHLGSKWLDNRFEEKLKATDRSFTAQLKETEQKHDVMVLHLRSSIDREFERATQLHTEEFKALSKGWTVLHEAYWRSRDATGHGFETYDFGAVTKAEADAFIATGKFPARVIEELLEADDIERRKSLYEKAVRRKQYAQCEDARIKLVMFVDRKSIFMQPTIKEKFERLAHLIHNANIEFRLRVKDAEADVEPRRRFSEFKQSDALRAGESVYKELESLIHDRLWSSTRNP